MSRIRLFLLISLVAGGCSQTFNVTTDSMSNTINAGQIIRMKDIVSIYRGDIVFFRRNNDTGQGKETWIFRVVGFSGDTVEIKDGNVIVNKKLIELPEAARLMYIINTSKPLDIKSFRKNTVRLMAEHSYIAYLTMDEYTNVSKRPDITEIIRIISRAGEHFEAIVRNDFTDNWNADQFGPLYIPSVGEKIKISPANRDLYADILSDLQPDSTITIKEKLYFLMGDNRSNANDSRFIGLVTESNIIGYAEEKP